MKEVWAVPLIAQCTTYLPSDNNIWYIELIPREQCTEYNRFGLLRSATLFLSTLSRTFVGNEIFPINCFTSLRYSRIISIKEIDRLICEKLGYSKL